MKILACAVGFGMGPAGKLCSIINYNRQFEWYACGDRIDLSMFKDKPFIDACWSKNEIDLIDFIKKYDIKYVLDVLDPDLAILFKKLNLKVIYVDSLPFMWTEADIIPYDVDYYCAQKYINYSKNPALNSVKNFIWINPISTGKKIKKAKSDIVINFGGLHSPFGEGKEYYEIIMKALSSFFTNRSICITGGQNVIKLTNKLYPELSCNTYTHEEFLELVSGSELFITSPGLTTIYETCDMNIKTVILPPQNLSQFYNSSIAEKICKNVKVLDWNQDKLNLKYLDNMKNKTEEEKVRFIYQYISKLSKDEQYIKKFCTCVSEKLNEDFLINDNQFFTKNGVEEVSNIINKIREI